MKTFYYIGIIILTVLVGCKEFEPFEVTKEIYVNKESINLYFGEDAGDRSSIQLIASPHGNKFTWTSQDPDVVKVDQNGLVTAVGEGITTITVDLNNAQTVIDVNVEEFIPLVDFSLSTNYVIGFWQNNIQIFVTYEPENATIANLEWISSNNKVANVYDNGLIKTLEEGRSSVTASYGDIVKTVDVWVPSPPLKMDKSNWEIPGYNPNSNEGTIGYSSQHRSDGGGVPSIIDDNINTYWHASYSSPSSKYPHWIIIDLGRVVTIAQVGMARRTGDNRGQKGYQIFTCTEDGAIDLSNPNSWNWEDQGDFSLDSNKDGIQTHSVLKFPTARYVKIYIDEKFKGSNDYAMIGDFSIYIFDE